MGTKRFAITLLGVLLIGGCASVPKESPELSHELGQRISAMQQAHLELVRSYFELKRREVKLSFEEQWIPAYVDNFFTDSEITAHWDTLVAEDDKKARVEFLRQVSPMMIQTIDTRRQEYLQPLNELEAQVTDSLSREYDRILSANNTLTGFLSNASELDQQREQYMELMGASEAAGKYIERADEQSEKIMEKIHQANIN